LPHPPFEFDVKQFTPGTLSAKAFINNQPVAQHSVTTPGDVAALRITLDSSGMAPQTGVNDLVFVYAELTDSRGNLVPLNDKLIKFSLAGDIHLVNPEAVLTEQGKAAILVRIGDSLQGAAISAYSDDFNIVSSELALAAKAASGETK